MPSTDSVSPGRWLARVARLAVLSGAVLACAPMVACAGSPSPSATAPPLALAFDGSWLVRQVLIDERRADRLLYQVDDPRLVGRTLSLGARHIEADLPEPATCQQPRLVPERLALDALLARTLQPALPTQGAARLFDPKLPGAQVLDVAWISCGAGTFGPALSSTSTTPPGAPAPGRIWLALLPSGEALMPWHGHTLLVLQRSSTAGTPQPSFACSKARLPAEKAICASPALASYDRSLAQAWNHAMQFCDEEADCISEARAAQKQWVATRNRCEADQACLRKAMRERLDALMAPPDE